MKDVDLAKPEVVHYIVKRFGLHMSKKLGQNFLIRHSVVADIADAARLEPGSPVLEIGPGIGTLTQALAETGAAVTAVELDTRLLPVLDKTLEHYPNVRIVHGDIMKIDIEETMGHQPFTVCANLPYYITSPVLMLLLESRLLVESVTVMVQREAAQRLCAKVGSRDSGAITVAVNYYGTAQKLFDVSRGKFMPSPNVDSAVIRIDVNGKPRLSEEDEHFFFKVVKAGFSQRRKTAANAISSQLGIPKDAVYTALRDTGLPETARLEGLDMHQLIDFSSHLHKCV